MFVEKYLNKYFGFGPVAYVSNQRSHVMNIINNKEFVQFYKIRHIYEFMPSPGWF